MSQLDDLVAAVAAKVNDATVAFEAGKLRVNEHAQRRRVVFYRDAGKLKFATGPGRQMFGVPLNGQGTTEFQRFQRSESVMVHMRAEDEDALDALFDVVVNAIFDVGGPNVYEDENAYDWAGKDSQAAGQHLRRTPEIIFSFNMRLQSHAPLKPYAVISEGISTVTMGSNIVQVVDMSSTIGAMLRMSAVSGSAASWPDMLNTSSPATQVTPANQPTVTLINGYPALVFDGNDYLSWPLIAGNNGAVRRGFAFWYRPSSIIGVQGLLGCNTTGGASTPSFELFQNGSALEVNVNHSAFVARRASAPGVFTAGTPVFISWEFNGAETLEPDECVITVNKVRKVLNFTNDAGAPNDMPDTLVVPTGSMMIGASGVGLNHLAAGAALGSVLWSIQGPGVAGGGLLTPGQLDTISRFQPMASL